MPQPVTIKEKKKYVKFRTMIWLLRPLIVVKASQKFENQSMT